MHCELTLAGRLEADARLPALEMILARARHSVEDVQGPLAWLGAACGLESLPAGALTAGEPGFWVRADPVHLKLLRDRVVIVPVSGIAPERAAALIATLNRQFAGRHEFRAPHPDAWAMSASRAPLDAAPTDEVARRDLDACLPAAPWPALHTEVQMALHEHPANEGQELDVNGVWLWGAGERPVSAALPWKSLAARDPAARGLARLAGIRHDEPPPAAAQWLPGLSEEGRHLAILDSGLEALEHDWFAPLLAALRAEHIGLLTLHAPAEGASFELARGDLRRFWRRPRALAPHAHR